MPGRAWQSYHQELHLKKEWPEVRDLRNQSLPLCLPLTLAVAQQGKEVLMELSHCLSPGVFFPRDVTIVGEAPARAQNVP